MKALIITSSTLIIITTTVFANWFDDINKTSANSKTTVAPSINSNQTSANIGFGMSFNGNGNSLVHSPTSTLGSNNSNNFEQMKSNSTTSNSFAPLDFNPLYTPTPVIKTQIQKKTKPKQNYKELRTMWEAQRKQAVEMLKRIDEAEK